MSKICHCFGAGEFFGISEKVNAGDLVIAADGGFASAEKCGLVPDYIIGDFDSSAKPLKAKNITVLPAEKDTTDMLEAIKIGAEKGCTIFHIYGGTGGRLDHTIANIQLLKYFSGARLYFYGNGFVLTAVTNGKISLPQKNGGYVSVFSLSDISEGVSLKNLKYELENYTLKSNFPLGVSNEFIGRTAEISVKNGTVLIYYTV